MDPAKLLDVLTSLPVSQSILPRVMCFATSRPANHAICSFIYSSGNASGPVDYKAKSKCNMFNANKLCIIYFDAKFYFVLCALKNMF